MVVVVGCGVLGGLVFCFFCFLIFSVFLLFDVENAKEKLGKMKEWNDTVLLLELRVHFCISFVC